MQRLIYTSRSHADLTPAEISLILSDARRRNAKDGITGLLIYHNRCILQVLEGERHKVRACYARISKDKRHYDVRLKIDEPVETAIFSNWFMGYQSIDGMSDLSRIASGKTLISLNQLKSRLNATVNVRTTDRKQRVMELLRGYLAAASAQDTVEA